MEENPRKKVVAWFVKIRFLKEQVEKLEKLKDFPIIAISVFLLKCQIIEFELKQLIFSFDLHMYSQNHSQLLRKKIRTPKDLDDLTLGKLAEEVRNFISPPVVPIRVKTTRVNSETSKEEKDLEKLNRSLDDLVSKRNEFTHRLFGSEKDIKELFGDAEIGIKIANKILCLLESLEEKLKNYEKLSDKSGKS